MNQTDRMRGLPSGNVTFMFTDIEGSTRLHQRLGPRFAALIAEHDAMLGEVIDAAGGSVIRTMGDGLFAAFGDAAAAINASTEIQRRVATHEWPDLVALRVRIGLHTGYAEPTGPDYIALAVHQAARVSAAANGGQVLVTTEVIAASDAPQPVRSWGRFKLKDFDEPIELVSVGPHHDDDPVPRAAPAAAHNVPEVRTSFVGRQAELADLMSALGLSRLVSVLGPGGVGKTRLSFELTAAAAPSFSDGATVVLLANTRPGAVLERCLQALGLPQRSGTTPQQTLLDALAPRRALVVFDNCEHVVEEVAGLVAEILDACPHITILTTSREPLRLADEYEWRLDPLQADGPDAEAVELFVDRARLRNPKLSFGPGERAIAVTICEALDGIPLALELAAARLRHVTLPELAERLRDRLAVVGTGDRSADERQRNLDNLVAWSYTLLTPTAQQLLRTLAVFRGPMRLDAIEAIADMPDAQELLSELVDKSLVTFKSGSTRPYRMLVTIRDFAKRELRADDRAAELRGRHREWHLRLAARIEEGVGGAEAESWLDEADAAYDDLLAAAFEGARSGCPDTAARLGLCMFSYFCMRGRLTEGRRWLERGAAVCDDPVVSALATARAGALAVYQGDIDSGHALAADALERLLALGASSEISEGHYTFGLVQAERRELDLAAEHFALASLSEVPRTRANSIGALGAVAFFRGDYDEAERQYRAAYETFHELRCQQGLAVQQMNLGEVLLKGGAHEEAESLLLAAANRISRFMRVYLPLVYEMLSQLHSEHGDPEEAAFWLDLAYAVAVELGDTRAQQRLAAMPESA